MSESAPGPWFVVNQQGLVPQDDACDGCGCTDWTTRIENQGQRYCGPCYVDRLAPGHKAAPIRPRTARKP